jgi:hypothetical protein
MAMATAPAMQPSVAPPVHPTYNIKRVRSAAATTQPSPARGLH